MVEFINELLINLLIISAFAVIGLFLERQLVKGGCAPNRNLLVLLVAFFAVVMKQIWFKQVSWWIFAPAIILAMTLGVHRGDIWRTMQHGRWWWKENNNK
jgi:hypothetical protein